MARTPLYGDFDGRVPALIHVGADEVLFDGSLRIAERMAAAGSIVDLHVWQRMTHVFLTNTRLQAATAALQLSGAFLRRIRTR